MSVYSEVQDIETQSEPRLLVLHAVRLKGTAAADVVSEISGLAAAAVEAELSAAEQEGLLQQRTGRVSGFRLTPAGKEQHRALLAQDAGDARRRRGLEQAYTGFLPLNGELKDVCGRWQLRPDGTANDHADQGYDDGVVADLGRVEERAGEALRAAGADCARLSVYAHRLRDALVRVQAGERDAFARPMSRSFHDVWMELHQDLLLSLGRDRDAADGH